jgi:gamma-glutamyltranspeptidase/glutathione hydrolase
VVTALQTFGTFGAVASTHWLSTATAMSVLERGGNAFDAAVAGAFVLVVAEPDQNGLGGEVPILMRTAANGEVRVICGQGPAPGAATPAAFARLGLDLIPGSGVLPACVPGTFDAWMLLARDSGTWRLRELFEHAIGYAKSGVPVSAGLAKRIGGVAEHFRAHWPSSAALYLANGLPRAGQLLRNPALAAMLERIVREAESAASDRTEQIEAARRSWREGFVAEAAIGWIRGREITDHEGRTDMALLAAEDWAGYSATLEKPASARSAHATTYKAGPWSQGPVLLQTLSLLEEAGIAEMAAESPAYVHTVIEALKLGLADREAWYGDPLFVDVPVDALLDPAYARERLRLIGRTASADLRPGSPLARAPRLPARANAEPDASTANAALRAARILPAGGDTAHIEVVDRHRNVVSAAPSGGWLQSSPVIPELGFPLGTRAQMFWLEEGLPNSLAPRKRPRTTLTPTLVVTDDGAVLGCGSPGGDAQDQWNLQFLLRHLVQGSPIHEAVVSPSFQSLHMTLSFWPRTRRANVVQMEEDWDKAVVEELRARGHEVEIIPAQSQGWPCVVRASADGVLSSAASTRGRNCAAAVR